MIRFLFRLGFLTLVALLIVVAGGSGYWLYWLVAVNPGSEIEEENIRSILGRETPVFYSDGEEKIGVFFGESHRKYLYFDQIPKKFVDALVAAEDDHFFYHFGVYLPGIVRSVFANYRAGRVVQGGSTITQQTAKNLFKRQARTYEAKIKELLYALRLEYRYPKEKIFEFYVNQFYVNGNGLGLGVAARYYFDKEPHELTLLESAFIAGSVKRPSYYNPFIKQGHDMKARAVERAKERAGYVLRRMRELGMIGEAEFKAALAAELQFREGKTTYALNTTMDLVREGLGTTTIEEALVAHDVDNVVTSGLRIITTVDKALQEETLAALRGELSRLDVRLRGYEPEEVQAEYTGLDYEGDTEAMAGNFLFGRIVASLPGGKDGPEIVVSLDHNQGSGIVDRKGLDPMVTAIVKWRDSLWAEAKPKDLDYLLQRVRIGDRVYVSVRKVDEQGRFLLNLERYPKVEGGAMIMRHGAIRAMAGGAANRFYNRAIHARRPMGSTFKPLLFAVAMQLGWNPTDRIRNRRDVFVFQGQPYFPRPDHHSPHAEVSISWAGVKSENLAAVWLLYHLVDQLTLPQFRDLATKVDMAPLTGNGGAESSASYRGRIRDRFGIHVTPGALEQAAYEEAVRSLKADFLFEGRLDEYQRLLRLHHGRNFDTYRRQVTAEAASSGPDADERQEMALRQGILAGHTYLGLSAGRAALLEYRRFVEALYDARWDLLDAPGEARSLPGVEPGPGQGGMYRDLGGRYVFSRRSAPQDAWTLVSPAELVSVLEARGPGGLETFWGDVLVEGEVSAQALGMVAAQAERKLQELSSLPAYSFEVLATLRDFRVMVGLRYLLDFSRAAGLDSELDPVLSYPLGSSVVSLIEEVRLYESLCTGNSYRFLDPGEALPGGRLPLEESDALADGLAIIDRIETAEHELIYQRKILPQRILDPRISLSVSHILENTITFGTGRHAHQTVRLRSDDPTVDAELKRLDLPVPLLGKTGTANRYTNSAFFGFVPGLGDHDDASLAMEAGSSVGVYVGFDDNSPMVRKSTRISGSSGALQVWARMAESLLRLDKVGERIDRAGLSFNGLDLRFPDLGQIRVQVDQESGGNVPFRGVRMETGPGFTTPAILSFGRIGPDAIFDPARFYMPYWKDGR